jgi:protein-L-isoaspartate(D-aspartate) O-methyltransferase
MFLNSSSMASSLSMFDEMDRMFDAAFRMEVVDEQLRTRGIRRDRVLQSMFDVPRHRFLPSKFIMHAYDDEPLPIGYHRSVYQPYIVALMAEAAEIEPSDRILEIGTGCGYTTAVLSRLAQNVFSLEEVDELCEEAEQRLRDLGFQNIAVVHCDGTEGYPDSAPYDAIIVNPATESIPASLFQQLAAGGRLVAPMIREHGVETLSRFTRLQDDSLLEETILEQKNPWFVDELQQMQQEEDDETI